MPCLLLPNPALLGPGHRSINLKVSPPTKGSGGLTGHSTGCIGSVGPAATVSLLLHDVLLVLRVGGSSVRRACGADHLSILSWVATACNPQHETGVSPQAVPSGAGDCPLDPDLSPQTVPSEALSPWARGHRDRMSPQTVQNGDRLSPSVDGPVRRPPLGRLRPRVAWRCRASPETGCNTDPLRGQLVPSCPSCYHHRAGRGSSPGGGSRIPRYRRQSGRGS